MDFITKIKRIGDSDWILVPVTIKNELSLDTLDTVKVTLEKISSDLLICSYKCKSCETYFDTDDENPYCPTCENENLVKIYEE